jgi:hypothetical protein
MGGSGVEGAMGGSGVEGHHDFRIGIGGIDLGDLHGDRGLTGAALFTLQLGHLLVVGENRDDRNFRTFSGLRLAFLVGAASP